MPVFLVGALQDEQVGPQWPALIDALHRDKNVYVTMMNGTHTDSLGPDTISRWLEFLDLYVADRVPTRVPHLDALAPAVYSQLTGGAAIGTGPRHPLHDEPSVAAAKAAFAAQDPRVRVLFDNGGGTLGPGALQPTYEAGFSTWPPAGTVVHFGLGRRRHAPDRARRGPLDGLASTPIRPSARPTTWPPRPTPGPRNRPTTGPRSPLPTASPSRLPPSPRATTIVGPGQPRTSC